MCCVCHDLPLATPVLSCAVHAMRAGLCRSVCPCRPLYRALFKSKMGRQVALDTFAANRSNYHPIAQKMVAADLGVADA